MKDIQVVQNGNFIIAFGIYEDPNCGEIHFAGAAKRHPKDEFDVVRGINIAMGKAYINLGTQLVNLEMGLLAHEEEIFGF